MQCGHGTCSWSPQGVPKEHYKPFYSCHFADDTESESAQASDQETEDEAEFDEGSTAGLYIYIYIYVYIFCIVLNEKKQEVIYYTKLMFGPTGISQKQGQFEGSPQKAGDMDMTHCEYATLRIIQCQPLNIS